MLNIQQIESFERNGFALVENVIDPSTINEIKDEIDRWSLQSRKFKSNFGSLLNGEPRFDIEPGHSPLDPRLRRISSPHEVSEVIKDCIFDGPIPQHLVPLLGPDIKFDHCKINSKYPGMAADVKYHQDHIFEPQTNDSMVTMLLMLDDATESNGCLKIVPGSHKKKHSHSVGDFFTGRIDDAQSKRFDRIATPVEARAGSICIMDTWAVHGSDCNRSNNPRSILIAEYKAADAFPLTTHKIPSRYMDSMVLGEEALEPRYRKVQDFEVPMSYDGDSLFDLQDIVNAKYQETESKVAVF